MSWQVDHKLLDLIRIINMELINSLTDEARQAFTYNIDGGEQLSVTLYYYPTQRSWFFDFSYGSYTCNGERVVLTWNALRHLKHIIPFGIAFLADSLAEPYAIDDFSSGRVRMYILNQEEVTDIESEIYGE